MSARSDGTTGPTVAAGLARAFLDLAVSKGADRRGLLERSLLDPAELLDQDHRVPLSSYLALVRAGKELCEEPALALQFGERVDMAEISIVSPVLETCETAADALSELNRYSRLLIDDGGRGPANRLVVTRSGSDLWLQLTCDVSVDYPELTESTLARIVSGFRRRSGGKSPAKAVHVTHGEPGYRAEYERILGASVVFDSDRNALLVDGEFLSLELPSPNPYLRGVLGEHADALLERLEDSRTTRGEVERLLAPGLHKGELGMERVAKRLGLGRQTLYRRLKAEGVTYETVLDELRRETALHLLQDRGAPVNEVAYRVGYSDPSAFSRAFKRWTGRSPGTLS